MLEAEVGLELANDEPWAEQGRLRRSSTGSLPDSGSLTAHRSLPIGWYAITPHDENTSRCHVRAAFWQTKHVSITGEGLLT